MKIQVVLVILLLRPGKNARTLYFEFFLKPQFAKVTDKTGRVCVRAQMSA